MAKWFCLIDGQLSGPLEPADLKRLAASGQLKPTDKVRRVDIAEWFQANQVKGLFSASLSEDGSSAIGASATSPSPPVASVGVADAGGDGANATEEPTAASDSVGGSADPDTSVTPQPSGENGSKATITDRIKDAARLASKQAALKTLQLTSLFNADLATGAIAHVNSYGRESFGELFKSVDEIDRELADKRVAEPVGAHETIADRTKRLARATKKRLDIERLLQKRKRILAQLGKSIRESKVNSAELLSKEIREAQAVAAKASALEKEIAELSARQPPKETLRLGIRRLAADVYLSFASRSLCPSSTRFARGLTRNIVSVLRVNRWLSISPADWAICLQAKNLRRPFKRHYLPERRSGC
jgi:hypothetical protein